MRFVGATAGRARPAGAARGASAREGARAFLRRHGDAFGLSDQAKELRVASSPASAGRALVGPLPAAARRRPGARRRARRQPRRRRRRASPRAARSSPARVATSPRVRVRRRPRRGGGRRGRRARSVRRRGSARTMPELWIYDARLLGGPGPQTPDADLAPRGQGRQRPADQRARARRRRARLDRAQHRPDRGGIKNRSGLRRGRPATSQLPCVAPVADRGPGPRQPVAGRQLRLRLRGRHLRLLRGPRARQPRRQRAAAASRPSATAIPARAARTRTRSGTGSRWSTARASRPPTTSSPTS